MMSRGNKIKFEPKLICETSGPCQIAESQLGFSPMSDGIDDSVNSL